jgi:cysteine synthase
VEAIGYTLRLQRLPREGGANATLLAELEYFNPAASVKERIGAAMIVAVEKAGAIDADAVLSGGQHSSHKIQGIGAGFIPSWIARALMRSSRSNRTETIETSRAMARHEGIAGGI